ncbi:MAG: hypothetical protein R3F53_10940 [Gammaproteobacteria bacterium]
MKQMISFFFHHSGYVRLVVSTMFVIVGIVCIVPFAQADQSLEQRVRAYWDAKVSGDAVLAYEYEVVKANGTVPLSKYVRGTGKLIYEEVAVLNVEVVAPEQAIALLEMQIVVPGMMEPLTTKLKDSWVEIDGKWYHSPPKPRLGS